MRQHLNDYHRVAVQLPSVQKKYVTIANKQAKLEGKSKDTSTAVPVTDAKRKYKPRKKEVAPPPSKPLPPTTVEIRPVRDPYLGIEECDTCGHRYKDLDDFYLHRYIHMGADMAEMVRQKTYHIMTPDGIPVAYDRLYLHHNGGGKCLNAPLLPDKALDTATVEFHLRGIYTYLKQSFKVRVGVSRILRRVKAKDKVDDLEPRMKFFRVNRLRTGTLMSSITTPSSISKTFTT
jgi:hypothetical protein